MPRGSPGSWAYVPYTPHPVGGHLRAIDTATGDVVPRKRARKRARKTAALPPDDIPVPKPTPKPPHRPNARKAQLKLFRRLQHEENARQAAIRAEVYAAGLIPWADEDDPTA